MLILPIQSEKLRIDFANTYSNTINNSCICVCWVAEFVAEYVNYIGKVAIEVLKRNNLHVNIVVGANFHLFENGIKTIYINMNYEHCCVTEPYPNGTYIHDIDKFSLSDIVVDYSIPNIHSVMESTLCDIIAQKMVYVSPLLYDNLYLLKDNKSICVLTTFISLGIPRRIELMKRIKEIDKNYQNITELFNKEVFIKEILQDVFKHTKVLINIHQDDNRKTFEELRVLPALQCGVIVICEESAYNELIPYNNLIIWSSYDKIVDKLVEVLENYDVYHSKIFCEENVTLLNGLQEMNVNALEKKILELKQFNI